MAKTATTKKASRTSAKPNAADLTAEVYNVEGKKSGTIKLPEAVFNVRWNADLVYDVVRAMQSNARGGTAHTKDRSEVSGGGRKPWKQKGTGRARHGSRRSPIWAGGGVAHGPRKEKDYAKKINKNAGRKALACVLSKKYKDGEIIFVDDLQFAEPKTKSAKAVMTTLSTIAPYEKMAGKKRNAALVVLPARSEHTERSFRNFGNMLVEQAKDVSPVNLLSYKYVIVASPDVSLEMFKKRVALKSARQKAKK